MLCNVLNYAIKIFTGITAVCFVIVAMLTLTQNIKHNSYTTVTSRPRAFLYTSISPIEDTVVSFEFDVRSNIDDDEIDATDTPTSNSADLPFSGQLESLSKGEPTDSKRNLNEQYKDQLKIDQPISDITNTKYNTETNHNEQYFDHSIINPSESTLYEIMTEANVYTDRHSTSTTLVTNHFVETTYQKNMNKLTMITSPILDALFSTHNTN
ncbi:hypothetical protein COBT_002386 [Conglomerata obtusa]